jgi:hypothetical protein
MSTPIIDESGTMQLAGSFRDALPSDANVPQHAGCMADGRDRLAGSEHRLDQCNRPWVLGQIP